MSPSPTWSDFQHRQTNALPLSFVHGMRHSLDGGVSCAMHSHPVIEIVYHPSGHGVTRTERHEELPFQPGSAVISPPKHLHDQVLENGGEDFCVQIAPPPGKGILPKTRLYIPFVDNPCTREEIHLLSAGRPGLSAVEQSVYNLRATALLLELIRIAASRQAHDAADPAEQHVLTAEQYIRENFSTIGSLPALAARVGVSYDHLRHAFRARRGITLIRHLNDVRIERAQMLLKHSRLPLKQVATMCGFKDEYYFSAVFQRYTKTSPGGYRHARA